jgi:hypothetical protein
LRVDRHSLSAAPRPSTVPLGVTVLVEAVFIRGSINLRVSNKEIFFILETNENPSPAPQLEQIQSPRPDLLSNLNLSFPPHIGHGPCLLTK